MSKKNYLEILNILNNQEIEEEISFDNLLREISIEQETLATELDFLEEKQLILCTSISRYHRLIKITYKGRKLLGEHSNDVVDKKGTISRHIIKLKKKLKHIENYTNLSGNVEKVRDIPVNSIVFRPEFRHLKVNEGNQENIYSFENAILEIFNINRLILLGDPGGGKSTTLFRLILELLNRENNVDNLIPLFVSLGNWTIEEQSIIELIKQENSEISSIVDELLEANRIAILLDGLNEIPILHQKEKEEKLKDFLNHYPESFIVITCRYHDYEYDLGLDKVIISPLRPNGIREFLTNHLGIQKGEELFWHLGGGKDAQELWKKWHSNGATFENFWFSEEIPDSIFKITSKQDDMVWKNVVKNEHSLMKLAQNPYMLMMLTIVYLQTGAISNNRGNLFHNFIETLLVREGLAERDKNNNFILLNRAENLLSGLKKLSYSMQLFQSGQYEGAGAVTSIDEKDCLIYLTIEELELAISVSILEKVGLKIRFVHQLLQEYFLASFLKSQIEKDQFDPTEINYLNDWSERNNWEESIILLAGLYNEDCSPILNIFKDVNPLITAYCIKYSGSRIPDGLSSRLGQDWSVKLTNEENIFKRDVLTRTLGMLDLDKRKGVSLNESNLPDIKWIEISLPDSTNGEIFYMSKYLVTNIQFQAFVDDDGFSNSRWWEDVAEQEFSPIAPLFDYTSYPRDSVSWYAAVAFCRWLSSKFGFEVRLPTELEWEQAAGINSEKIFPYGNTFNAKKGNFAETGMGRSTAVGIFPEGDSIYGMSDMSGNLWEWCLDVWENGILDTKSLKSRNPRVIKGGSFIDYEPYTKIKNKRHNVPHATNPYQGFRIITKKK